ncbi:30S ribosome-binding factor RbfA [Oleispirillum naphthae]|uniref:30S ribosome-binding factor RbfA n=1 Tax=Oleispirillum naphthae TaxID=2838853 RepID=UPI0030825525
MIQAPSQRQLRVGEEIRHLVAQALERGELHDPVLDVVPVTISEVRVSPDLRHATAFVMPLGGLRLDEVLAALSRNAWMFNKLVARALRLRYTPTLAFIADGSFDEASHIDEVLRRPEVARDLSRPEEGDA